VADPDEARREDVLEEEPGEVRSADGAESGRVSVRAVLVAEGDVLPVVVGDPGVRDRDAVDVSGEVADDVGWSGERRLRVDVPDLGRAPERGQGIFEVAEDPAGAERLLELREELGAEDLAELLDGQEEALRGSDPARPVEGESAAGTRQWM